MQTPPTNTTATADPTFRVGPAEQVTDAQGRHWLATDCYEYIDGRWEGFSSLHRTA